MATPYYRKIDVQAECQSLLENAVKILGRERADAIRMSIEELAQSIVTLYQNLPGPEEVPAFYQSR